MSDIIAHIYVCQDCMVGNVNEGDALAYNPIGGSFPCDTTPDFDAETGEGVNEWSDARCDNCGDPLTGNRFRFAVWAWL